MKQIRPVSRSNTVAALAVIMLSFWIVKYKQGGVHSRASAHAPAAGTGHSQGSIAPDFELKSLDGKLFRLSDFRGKAVLLNFWATWCSPCRIEMPWFVEFYKQYQAQGLEIVGVSMDDRGQGEEVLKFTKERNLNYTILLGTDDVGNAYGGVRFLPETFFIDRNGKIVGHTYGIREHNVFENDIKKLLGASVDKSSMVALRGHY